MSVDENTIYKYIIYMTVAVQGGEVMEFCKNVLQESFCRAECGGFLNQCSP